MKRVLWVVLSVFLISVPGFTSVSAANVATDMSPLIDEFYTCEEVVAFEGRVHYIQNRVEDGNGGFHEKLQWSYVNVKGYGVESGERYVIQASDTVVANIKAGTVISGPFQSHAIALGSASDFHIRGTYHITTNADGEIVTEVSQLKASCVEQ